MPWSWLAFIGGAFAICAVLAVLGAFLGRGELERLDYAGYKSMFKDSKKRKHAVKAVLEIRRFEIELYWRRAAYFWAFILLAYTGYAFGVNAGDKFDTLVLLVVLLGVAISFAWHLVNKGSKYWQENWENHLDLLEHQELGDLYKTVVSRPSAGNVEEAVKRFLIGPESFSVSKLHSLVSLLNTAVWVLLLLRTKPFDVLDDTNFVYLTTWTVALGIVLMLAWGRTENRDHENLVATRRKVSVEKP